jgi:O-antigen/teichoic acid export membrane protein
MGVRLPVSRLNGNGPRGRGRGRTRSGRSSLAIEMAAQIGRESIFYTIVTGAIFPIGLLNAVVFTHYMSTTQYGQLGVLFFISALMSVVMNLLFLRGVERHVWGSSDEGVDVDLAQLDETSQRPRSLGTGIVLTTIAAVVVSLAVIPFATPLSRLLLHTPRYGTAVVWMVASGAFGSVWRLAANIPRWERRNVPFALSWTLRPALAVGLGWPLVAAGGGITAAVAATAIATFVTSVYSLVVCRHSYQLVIDRASVWPIVSSSAEFYAMVLGLFVLHTGDVFLLSRYASASQVGIYRLATNLTSVVSYAVSAFLMAWAPLEWSTLFQAAYERHGSDRMRTEVFNYYLILCGFVVLALAALATPLIAVFSHRYGGAAGFVAVTGVGYMAYGLFLVIARSCVFPFRYQTYGVAAVLAAGGLIGTSILLTRSLGGYAVALGDTIGGLIGAFTILLVARLFGRIPPFNVWLITKLCVVAGVCWAVGAPVAALTGGWSPALKVLSVAIYPVLLVATGVIPVRDVGKLWTILRRSIPARRRPDTQIAGIAGLPGLERQVLVTIARDGRTAAHAGLLAGVPETTVRTRLVAGLRRLSDAGPPIEQDAAIGQYLLSDASVTERDGMARDLWAAGVAPVDLYEIEAAFDILRAARAKSWSASAIHRDDHLSDGGWAVDTATLTLLDEVGRLGRPRREVAARMSIDPRDLDRRFVGALRSLASGGASQPADSLIASFLLDGSGAPPARQLWAAGVDPLELHQLELTLSTIRSLPADRWREIRTEDDPALAEELAQMEPVLP